VGAKGTEGDGDRFSILYVDQFADRTIGLAVGFARLDEKGGVTSRFESWGNGQAQLNGAGPNLNVPYNGFNAWADQETRKRDGASATVQFRPNKNFTSTLDLFYSTFDKVKTNTGFQAPLNDAWNGNPGDYDSGGVLTQATVSGSDANSGTFNKVRAVVRNDSTSEKDKIKSIGWNNKFKIGEDWSINADLSKSNSKRDGGVIETTAGTAQSALGTAQLDTVAYTNAGQFTPGLNYTDRSIIKLTDVQGWGGGVNSPQAGYSKIFKVEDDLTGIRLSAKRAWPWAPSWQPKAACTSPTARRPAPSPKVAWSFPGRRTGLGEHARWRHHQHPHTRGLGDGGQLRLVFQHRLDLRRGAQAPPGHLQQGLDDHGKGHHGLCQG
jgi:iron complex outermembrane receptor protein